MDAALAWIGGWEQASRTARYGARDAVRKRGALILAAALALAPAHVAAEEIVIAALGDSLTQGFGLVEADGFVPQLERWLEARGADVDVINNGVSGDTTAGGAARVAWTLASDVDAMIVALGANDVLRGLDPAQARANLDSILTEAGARDLPVLLIGIVAPPNYGPDYQDAFNAIYPDLAKQHGALLEPDFLAAIREAPEGPAALLQGDMLHPNPAGVGRIVARVGPRVEALIAQASGS